MKKAVSIAVIFTVLISVTGFTIPCTLHCLYMDMEPHKEMCHHNADSEMECNGSCMVNEVSNTDNTDAARSDGMLLTQYRVNLLSPDIGSHISLFNPLKIETYFDQEYNSMHISWIFDPLVPPPKLLLSV